jgi:hypothetical protein
MMNSRFAAFPKEDAAPVRKTRSGRRLASMSEKQTEAYLIARDTLRRIRRVSSLVAPPAGRGVQLAGHSGERPARNRDNC